jgi:ABC-type phosphate/phosphonate transport system permease subunit
MLSRIIHGARLSLIIGFSVATLALITGTTLGLTAAFAGGVVDIVIMRLMDILLVFPSLLLAIVIVSILGPGLFNAMLAVVMVTLPGYTRLARASALSAAKKKSRPERVRTTKAKACALNWPSAAAVTVTSSTQITRFGLESCSRASARAQRQTRGREGGRRRRERASGRSGSGGGGGGGDGGGGGGGAARQGRTFLVP